MTAPVAPPAAVAAAHATARLDTPDSLSAFVAAHDNFLLDCDGVLWAGSGALPGESASTGAVETLDALRAAGKRVLFITNNSSKSRRQYAAKFAAFGVSVDPNDIVTSGSAMANYLKMEGITYAYVIGEDGLIEELELAGVTCIRDAKGAGPLMSESEFMALELDPKVQAVCVGWDRSFGFRQMSIASAYLQQGVGFIGANPDNADRVGPLLFPGTGPLLAAIQSASGAVPVIIGKPNPILIKGILAQFGMDQARTAMVGDRLDTDMAFANAGGISSVLVMTGVSTDADLAALSAERAHMAPAFVMAALASLRPALTALPN
ncbi:haloacid dehalogenase-like hydrolase family protein [Tribonema minus]|uniref:Haloacid dehalogenase-like hydrolase family protein n=1 Tax=Tribonema minus TaxID=303371 RepID=A0A836CPG6_9STRA|nr:haloacid dehalogenase-like hydrolase family protein [Tribonema minus]